MWIERARKKKLSRKAHMNYLHSHWLLHFFLQLSQIPLVCPSRHSSCIKILWIMTCARNDIERKAHIKLETKQNSKAYLKWAFSWKLVAEFGRERKKKELLMQIGWKKLYFVQFLQKTRSKIQNEINRCKAFFVVLYFYRAFRDTTNSKCINFV